MEEQLILFKTAELAKEKGFNIPTDSYCRITGSGYFKDSSPANWNDDIKMKTAGSMTYISIPTQSLLQRWLRELYHIHIEPHVLDNEEYMLTLSVVDKYGESRIDKPHKFGFASYEDALEDGLSQGLNLIK